MGDRTAIAVEIGGKLDRAHFAELVEVIGAECLGLDWTENAPDADELLAWLTAHPGEAVRLVNNETYASLDDLAPFCAEHGLSWRMCWDAYPGSYNAGGEVHDRDVSAEYLTIGTDGEVLLSAEGIRALGSWEAVTALLAQLERPLPAFELTGEWPADDADD